MAMLAYFDTSALIPLVIHEPATARCRAVWDAAAAIVTSDLTYVEAHAALAQARRLERLTDASHERAVAAFESLWTGVARIAVAPPIIREAAKIAHTQALRGDDAVHAASALAAASDDFVAVSGDAALLHAWIELGIATVDSGG
ncbi:type II toxin-antitoxin system VapC family toxin [Microbacterium sp. NPDC076895]|jgi:predicted nucleic acid-binding protein|uniref:type II toxin-antitoxin system VapC family toxin n=1 Tax=Microbacterium sp. NPDC076895 TaxID=3154957 RepID=UPI00343B72BC